MKTTTGNPVVRDIAKLIKTIRNSDPETLADAKAELSKFCDAWLDTGEGADLCGAGSCCLADTDTALALIDVIQIRLQ